MIPPGPWRTRFLAAAACLWLASVCAGMGVLLQYASTPGDPGEPPPADAGEEWWRSGRLVFSGGITVARGHAGDNAGRGAIEAFTDGDTAVRRQAPVFGCALHNPATILAGTEGAWKR